MWNLFLHGKQGDDFAAHVEAAKGNVQEALRQWAAAFARCKDACTRIADALSFSPDGRGAAVALVRLEKEGLLEREPR